MGKEVMNFSAEGGNIEMALALERTGIRWLGARPSRQSGQEAMPRDPQQFLQEQKERNIRTDVKG